MNDYLLELLTKYRNKGLLIDTNLLLLFIVGSLDPNLIPKLSRTASFSLQDFQIIQKTIDFFETKITTPHILTEVSNLVDRFEVQTGLRSYVEIASELFLEGAKIVTSQMFAKFGVTDTAILEVLRHGYLVLTNDGPLIGLLRGKEIDVVSLDQLRSQLK